MMTPRLRRPGLTLFQLLVVLALFAILLGLLLPAVQKVRQAAARAQGSNNIKQLMIAVHNYYGTYNAMPAGFDDNYFSATARLLPFIEQDAVYRTIDFKKSIDDKANADARKLQMKVLLSPEDPIQEVKPEWGATNYLFNVLVFSDKPLSLVRIADGTSNTIGIGETLKGDGMKKAVTVQRQHVLLDKGDLKGVKPDTGVEYFKDGKNIAGDRCASWMDGRFLMGTFNGQLQPNDMRPDVNCGGAGGVSALRTLSNVVQIGMCDGSSRAVRTKISKETWQAAITPDGGEVLGADWDN